jgi:hypothetical protein
MTLPRWFGDPVFAVENQKIYLELKKVMNAREYRKYAIAKLLGNSHKRLGTHGAVNLDATKAKQVSWFTKVSEE